MSMFATRATCVGFRLVVEVNNMDDKTKVIIPARSFKPNLLDLMLVLAVVFRGVDYLIAWYL